MTLLERPAETAPRIRTSASPGAPRTNPRRLTGLLKPGWPLSLLFVGFPLWWALGISEFMAMAMGVVMAVDLVRRRRILAPRGFGWWLLFLAWMPVGLVLLHVDAPGAVADNSSTRYLTFVYRIVWYLTVTVTLLYVGNARSELSSRRITRIMAAMFLTVTAGGLLGVLAPYLEFTSLAELLLPKSLASSSFVSHLVHPTAAQLQDVLGYQAPRPAAPFAYTNTWGLNFACFLPFFVVAWCGKDAGWRRYLAPVVLLVAAVPVIYSLNRGMWGALVVVALFVAIRSALMGRPGMLAAVLAGAVALVALVSLTSLGGIVTDRFTHASSTQGRTNLGTLTVTSVLASSPVVGLGSTRNVQGNFNTITGGATADCPRCSPPALGTQGQLWLVIFCQGVLGLLFYVAFFTLMLLRHIRLRSPEATAGLCVVVVGFITFPVYNSLGIALMAIMVGCGLLWREGREALVARHTGPMSGRLAAEPTIEGLLAPLRRYAVLVLACVLVGALAGGLWQKQRGVDQAAINSILLPEAATYPSVADGPMNMDTEAQLITTPVVLDAVANATHAPVDPANLTVTATSNTRILHIRYVAPTAAKATSGVEAATTAYLALRHTQLLARKSAELSALKQRATQLDSSIRAVDAVLLQVDPPDSPKVKLVATTTLRQKRAAFITAIQTVNGQTARVSADLANAGSVIEPALATPRSDVTRVALANGVNLGLAFGALLSTWLYRRGRRLRRTPNILRETGVAVLAEVHPQVPGEKSSTDELHRARLAVEVAQPAACLSADPDDPATVEVTRQLDDLAQDMHHIASGTSSRRGGRPAVMLVASDRLRTGDIARLRSALDDAGNDVCGLVLTRH